MTESTMFADLLAAQKAMPHLQKSAINPFYHNKYVPLESVLDAVLPILNEHNFVLLQQPSTVEGQPALTTTLLHASGEKLSETMLLCMKDASPQEQGSGLTYARRYALLATLGLTADADDDAEATRKVPPMARAAVSRGDARPAPPTSNGNGVPAPDCPQGHGAMKYWPEGVSKAGKPVSANYKCQQKGCDNGSGWPESIWEDKWETQVQLARGQGEPAFAGVDPDEGLPFE